MATASAAQAQLPPTPTQNFPRPSLINESQGPEGQQLPFDSDYRSVVRCLTITNLIHNIFAIFALFLLFTLIITYGTGLNSKFNEIIIIVCILILILLIIISSSCLINCVWTTTQIITEIPSFRKTNNRGWLMLTLMLIIVESVLIILLWIAFPGPARGPYFQTLFELHAEVYLITAFSTAFRIASVIFIDGFHQEMLEKYPPAKGPVRIPTTAVAPAVMPNEMSQYPMMTV